MKLIVIGSKGFIGTHTIQHLRTLGHEVYGCDVVVEYNDPRYFQVDATSALYDDIFSSHQFDACINCAGAASVPDSFVHPQRDFSLNSNIVFNLLEAIRKHNPTCKFLNLSSAAVYGNPEQLPVRESSPSKPLSPYGWHKHYSELICQEYQTYFNVPTCSLRIFSAYGPGLRKQIFWDWHKKVSHASHIILFGTGKESRDFIFIEDIVQAIACVVQKAPFKSDIFNVANSKEIFIEQAIETFKKESRTNFTYSFDKQVRKGDPVNWLADITKISHLGYTQKVSFEDGLKQYIEWLHERS